ncbi:MAG: site-2 protease family protein [Nanoarchaeota archaeon]|nr:site-2 protease family protein [Nanoarchaeota archaeon]
MNFILYDILFLVLFTLAVVLFLYTRRKNLQRQGLLYLYKTKVGIKFIDWSAKKFEKILKPLQYVVIASGYILMISMVWFLAKFSWFYLTSPTAARELKIPVLLPLLPYLPEIFKLDFLPPFYFTYWIIIIAIVAIPHEFAHGIFARLNKFKIHSTGFGFLGPFLAAFVEPDEKQMEKAKKFPQLAVLAAGTFANVIFTLIFVLLIGAFVSTAFTPAGVYFTYPGAIVNNSDIGSIGGHSFAEIKNNPLLIENNSVFEFTIGNETYLTTSSVLEGSIKNNLSYMGVSPNTPAFRAQIVGAISEINGEKINSYQSMKDVLGKLHPGDKVTVKTIYKENLRADPEVREYNVTLADRDGKAFLGIGVLSPPKAGGIIGVIYNIVAHIKDPTVYYDSNIGEFGNFIYDLLWWTALISISVALVNMLPMGIFDGGRFFYLTVWGITRSEKIGKKAYKISTAIILTVVALLMIKWVVAFI